MLKQGTKGAPNRILKQQHCNKFPKGGFPDYQALTKLTRTETGNFDDHSILQITSTLIIVDSVSSEIIDVYSSRKVPKRTTVHSNMPL